MSDPYIGEIRLVGFNFAPQGWALCDGQLLPIAGNDALFTLIDTTYGGDGETTFALPDLRSRVPVHQGTGSSGTTYVIGEALGAETVTLTANQIPSHLHAPQGNSNNGTFNSPGGNVWASSPDFAQYATGVNAQMASGTMASVGGSQPHDNMLPYLAINFIISLSGVFPSQS